MKLFLLLTMSLLNFVSAEMVKIECSRIRSWKMDYVGEVKECRVDDAKVAEKDSTVDSSSVNFDVTVISFWQTSRLHHFPHGIIKKFPNLKAISLKGQPITSLDQNDLKEFGDQLQFLLVWGQLTSLNQNIFKYNQKIKYINFFSNPLTFIDSGFFKALMKIDSLEGISLLSNSCINQRMFKKDFGTAKWEHFCNNESELVEEPYDDNEHGERICGKFKIPVLEVAGGEEFDHGLYPWIAAVMRVGKKNNQVFLCGGSLISRTKVVTAAHCIHNKKETNAISASNLRVLLGAHNLSDPHESERKTFNVEKSNLHSTWCSKVDHFTGDIAILILAETVTYDKYIQPVCLSKSLIVAESKFRFNEAEGKIGTVAGWGATEDELRDLKEGNSIPRRIQVPIKTTEYCREYSKELIEYAWEKSFCAGRNNVGVCGGDSGSGFYVESNGKSYLKGIVSFSLGGECGDEYLAIFSDATKYLPFVI